MLKEKVSLVNTFIAIVDVAIAIVSFNVALFIEFKQFPVFNKDTLILQLLIVAFWSMLVSGFGLNTIYRSRPYSVVFLTCTGISIIGSCLLAISVFVFNLFYLGLRPLIYFSAISLCLTFLFVLFTYMFFKTVRRRGFNYLNVLVIGDNSAAPFIRHIFARPEWGYRITAVIGDRELKKTFSHSLPFLPQHTDVEQLLRDKTIDEVVFCKKQMNQQEVEEIIQICTEIGVVFRMYSSFFNMLTNKTHLHYFGTQPLLTISNTPTNYLQLLLKSVMGYVISALALIVLLPVFLIIAFLIKFDSKGPVFFAQKRVGLHGRRFKVYKFRTMVVDAEKLKEDLEEKNEMDGPVFKIANDPRITRLGRFLRKTSLDELPQFFNVLKGDMSVVGPRPPIPAEVRQYERWQLRRLSMKPGITCIWQVSGRNNIPFDEWMKMDMEYIDNWSLKLDLIILLKTIRTILRGDGR
ncbi:MAG: sugar transferase [Cytophagaceae bacterium]|jgi:exopolysaccharide biosynthesis polyprenyl glycosylphosphotransferase|nr:sugar transferase [Cytophagaceae bacterium]